MHHSRALILRKDIWGEAGWLVTALSADFGKIRLLAQGARKHGAKLQGHIEPGAVSQISFVTGKNGYRLTTARLLTFPVLSRSLSFKLSAVAAILAALDRNLLEESDRSAVLADTAEAAIIAVESADDDEAARRVVMWFQIRLLAFLGLFPSPHSPEARSIPSLLSLINESPSVPAGDGDGPDLFEREFLWLARHLGSAFAAVGPVGSAEAAIY